MDGRAAQPETGAEHAEIVAVEQAVSMGARMKTLVSLAVVFLATTIGTASAQTYPTRTVNIIFAFPPGGPSEGVVRLLAEKLSLSLGHPIVIENRPGGAGGSVGTRSGRARHRTFTRCS
jgi:tripartite-type tricarboxylate transporter receptor subunit TctC